MDNSLATSAKSLIEFVTSLILLVVAISKIRKVKPMPDKQTGTKQDINRENFAYISLFVLGIPGTILLFLNYRLPAAIINLSAFILFLGFWLSIKSVPERIDILAAISVTIGLVVALLLLF